MNTFIIIYNTLLDLYKSNDLNFMSIRTNLFNLEKKVQDKIDRLNKQHDILFEFKNTISRKVDEIEQDNKLNN